MTDPAPLASPPHRPRMLPPFWLILCVAGQFFTQRLTGPDWIVLPGWVRALGMLPALAGLAFVVIGARRFRQADTPLTPGSMPAALVMGGIYRFTRNPMYLGMLLVLVGQALMIGSLLVWLGPVIFIIVIKRQFIRPEEALLETIFEGVYRDYCSRVRRWI